MTHTYPTRTIQKAPSGGQILTVPFPGPQTYLQSFTATLSFVGAYGPTKIFKGLAATFAPTAALTKKIIDSGFSATLSFVGALTRSKLFVRAFTGTLNFTGALTRQTQKAFSATLSFTGALARSMSKTLSATLSFVGALTKKMIDA